MDRERFLALLVDHCDNSTLTQFAFARLFDAMANRQLRNAVVMAPSLDIDGLEVLRRILPPDLQGLINDRSLDFDDGTNIRLCSQANLDKGHRYADAYLLWRPTQQLIQRVEELSNWRCLVVAAHESNVQQWRQQHDGIIDINENEEAQ